MKGFLKEGRPTGFFAQPVAQACLLAGFCLFLYVVNLGCWDLWNPDEPRYAHVVREMVSRGDWVLLHFNGKVYAEKPALLLADRPVLLSVEGGHFLLCPPSRGLLRDGNGPAHMGHGKTALFGENGVSCGAHSRHSRGIRLSRHPGQHRRHPGFLHHRCALRFSVLVPEGPG